MKKEKLVVALPTRKLIKGSWKLLIWKVDLDKHMLFESKADMYRLCVLFVIRKFMYIMLIVHFPPIPRHPIPAYTFEEIAVKFYIRIYHKLNVVILTTLNVFYTNLHDVL